MGVMMGANGQKLRLGRAGTAGALFTGILAATAAGAAVLPTGHMLSPRPTGPAINDLPASTSSGPYRIPTAFAYGLMGTPTSRRPKVAQASQEVPKETSPEKHTLREAPGVVHLSSVPDQPPAAAPSSPKKPSGSALVPVSQAFVAVCPVVLHDQRKAVPPKPQFSSVFEARRYHFSSAAAQAKFDANPRRYAPAHGGEDVVRIAHGKHDTVGSLKYAGYYHNRLYLFQSAETARVFHQNPAKYVGR